MTPSGKLIFILLLPLTLGIAPQAQAQAATGAGTARTPASAPGAKQWPLVRGEVVEVDRKDNRLTLKHGRIESIGMDPMTMEFLVRDAKLLTALKPGVKVRFAAIYKDGEYVITQLEVVKPRRPGKPPRQDRR